MGCSHSKFDDDEAVQICKDRKRFIKQAVEHRTGFASGHIAYIQSLRNVSDALREYIEGDEPHEFFLDTFVTPVKRTSSSDGFIEISSPPSKMIQNEAESNLNVNYLMASRSRPVRVEERPLMSPETFQVESYEADSFFGMNMNMVNSPQRSHGLGSHNIPPPSPQNSQWDFFWNPFSSLDHYGYSYDSNQSGMDDEMRRLRRVREEEGIPDLEEDEYVRFEHHHNMKATEDCNGDRMDQEDKVKDVNETENARDKNCIRAQEGGSIEVSSGGTTGHVVGVGVTTDDAKGETPGFTVYMNRRPTSMGEVIKDLEDQFGIICTAGKEVSGLLEASRAQYTSSSDLSAMKMLNPVALFRSGASSRSSSSSRFLISSSGGSRASEFETSSEFSEESCMLSGSHQSTLDRLYAWEKKLYDEVKSGERIRIAYEKKCLVLRNQDVKGADSSAVDKTRTIIRDLHTQIKVSIHSIESISERIETLRDQELLPQLLELLQGLAQMWKVMAECHQIQKRTLDEAKLLLATTPSNRYKKQQQTSLPEINSQRLARSALNLVAQLRNWRTCFQAWITSQRSYVLSLTGWLLRCFRCDPDPDKVRLVSCPHPIYEVCIQWSRLLNGLNEKPVVDKLDFFASGMGAVYARQLREDPSPVTDGSRKYSGPESMELVEADKVEEEKMMAAEKLAEIAVKVLCHGMSVAVSSLAEFAISSADEHSKLINHPENTMPEQTEM
ncbi:nitrate regulatory gene2 protein [Capsella rubella]|uniref:nitrate regulatory gene2 protein n=1 Tax=Capsella rubella TaxID=81985 RepID=UPI000CD59E48|nr:nitrate regulatory gene2 protein [Capsella rubella]XP_023635690.1 nitrate regulatory gene2 protein [Capsella rubella]